MTEALFLTIQHRVEEARAALALADAGSGTRLLRQAETVAGTASAGYLDAPVLQGLLDLRNELGCYLLAAEQLERAGVGPDAVIGVLRRGAVTADGILARLTTAVGGRA